MKINSTVTKQTFSAHFTKVANAHYTQQHKKLFKVLSDTLFDSVSIEKKFTEMDDNHFIVAKPAGKKSLRFQVYILPLFTKMTGLWESATNVLSHEWEHTKAARTPKDGIRYFEQLLDVIRSGKFRKPSYVTTYSNDKSNPANVVILNKYYKL